MVWWDMAHRRATTTLGTPSITDGHDGPVLPGDLIGDRYIVEEVLGEGGMGVVLAARHDTLGHRVAIKLLSASPTLDADAFVRFSREARIIANVESDHVVRLIDYGMHRGAPYMVMELLAGCDLGRELARRGPLPIEDATDNVIQACDGLWAAHLKGIVHRDVKLANLFLAMRADGERVVKVLDFGVSKLQTETQEDVSLTRTTTMLGSPQYMSPEQIRDPRTVDARADVWSLGIVLFKLLTNESPFVGLNANAVCASIAADPPAAIEEYAPQLPPDLAAVVMRCLEKQPGRRYANVAALAKALAPYASPRGREVAERLVARAISDGLLDEPPPVIPEPAAVARPPRRRLPWLGAIAVMLAIVAGAIVWNSSRGSADAAMLQPSPPVPAASPKVEAVAPPIIAAPEPVTAEPVVPTVPVAPPSPPQKQRARSPARVAKTAPAVTHPTVAPPTRFGGSALDDHN